VIEEIKHIIIAPGEVLVIQLNQPISIEHAEWLADDLKKANIRAVLIDHRMTVVGKQSAC
jgi:hypothetical protein